jgi:hypothetical protein
MKPPTTLNRVNLLRVISATPATKGTKVRMNGMKRAKMMVMPPYFS